MYFLFGIYSSANKIHNLFKLDDIISSYFIFISSFTYTFLCTNKNETKKKLFEKYRRMPHKAATKLKRVNAFLLAIFARSVFVN